MCRSCHSLQPEIPSAQAASRPTTPPGSPAQSRVKVLLLHACVQHQSTPGLKASPTQVDACGEASQLGQLTARSQQTLHALQRAVDQGPQLQQVVTQVPERACYAVCATKLELATLEGTLESAS